MKTATETNNWLTEYMNILLIRGKNKSAVDKYVAEVQEQDLELDPIDVALEAFEDWRENGGVAETPDPNLIRFKPFERKRPMVRKILASKIETVEDVARIFGALGICIVDGSPTAEAIDDLLGEPKPQGLPWKAEFPEDKNDV